MTWRSVKAMVNHDECNAEENNFLFIYISDLSPLLLSWHCSSCSSCSLPLCQFQDDFRGKFN